MVSNNKRKSTGKLANPRKKNPPPQTIAFLTKARGKLRLLNPEVVVTDDDEDDFDKADKERLSQIIEGRHFPSPQGRLTKAEFKQLNNMDNPCPSTSTILVREMNRLFQKENENELPVKKIKEKTQILNPMQSTNGHNEDVNVNSFENIKSCPNLSINDDKTIPNYESTPRSIKRASSNIIEDSKEDSIQLNLEKKSKLINNSTETAENHNTLIGIRKSNRERRPPNTFGDGWILDLK